MSELKEVNEAALNELMQLESRGLLVDFWSPWCGPCRPLKRQLAQLAGSHADKESRIGTNARSAFMNYYCDFGGDVVRKAPMYAGYSHRKTADNRTQDEKVNLGGSIELYEFARTTLSYSDGEFRPLEGEPGQFGDVVHDDQFWSMSLDFNTRSSKYGYGVSHSSGDLGGGEYEYSTGYVWLRLTSAISLNMSTEKLTSFGTFRQSIVGGNWDITPQSSVFMRYVAADDDEFWRLGYRRHVNSGRELFLLYDDEPFAPTEASVKYLWAF